MNRYYSIIYILVLLTLTLSCSGPDLSQAKQIEENAIIFPDYNNVSLPLNIASPNFQIKNSADQYYVEITGSKNSIGIASKNGDIQIPLKAWKKFTKEHKEEEYKVEIYTKNNGEWQQYNTLTNTISPDSIDSYVMYRFINAANILWNKMGIYQRDIESFDVSPIMDNSLTDENCMHCHSVASNNSNSFMLHMRGKPGGTIIYKDNELKFINTKTEHTISAGGYPSWHPNGKYIAFSTNKISQRFHATKEKYAFVFDSKSDIILYDVDKNEIQAIPALSKPEFENMPTWSPDGKYLYFLSSKPYSSDTIHYTDIKYDLKRISFNQESKEWGEIENLILADSIGKSVAFPRVSPDNKHVVMCLADYGYFTVYNETSDIALLNLETKQIINPDINSKHVESYPSWSSNGKWIMFNSKRADGVSSRPYFSYFNDGKAHKPFILPQEYANWNFDELFNINRPEFITSKIPLNPQEILKLVQNEPTNVDFDLNSLKGMEKESTEKRETDNAFDFNQ